MEKTTLFDLNEYLKRVIALNFQEPIWVSCEISQVNEVRGQVYMDLVQQEEGSTEVIAQSSAVIWYKSYLFIKNKLKELLPSILTVGTHVLLKVRVEYHERWGMKLVVEDIDPSYTIGQMEMARQKILQQLLDADVLDKNEALDLPIAISSVAVISSATAAGYKDFLAQIEDNDYGYQISSTLFAAAMQGLNTEREVCQALDQINEAKDKYDAVVIIRGGGSKLDLSGFDNYNIGYKIATFPIPVLTGIGHEIDQSVADVASHSAFKTPTAVATFLIDHNLGFESEILQMSQFIGQISKQQILLQQSTLQQVQQLLLMQPKTIIEKQAQQLEQIHNSLKQSARFAVKEIGEHLSYTEKIIKLADPMTTLKRGYSIIKKEGESILSAKDLKKGDDITITYFDGKKTAQITK